MAVEVVVRAALLEAEEVGAGEASGGGGLERWLGGGGGSVRVRLRLLRASRLGLLVQRPPGEGVEAAWWPVLQLERLLGARLCRYHEGPEGRPWEHVYCTRPAVTRDGYCRLHARSGKALYERCAQGVDSACREAERLLGRRRYVVYALDYGGSRLKIGLTQEWRLLYRAAAQPHVSVAVVARVEGLVEARAMERRLGRLRGATEGAGARLGERLRLSAAMSGLGAEERARRMAGLLAGLGLRGSFEAFAVLPREGYGWLLGAPRAGEPPAPAELRLLDYWGGLMLFEARGGARLVVDRGSLLHRVAVGGVRGVEGETR